MQTLITSASSRKVWKNMFHPDNCRVLFSANDERCEDTMFCDIAGFAVLTDDPTGGGNGFNVLEETPVVLASIFQTLRVYSGLVKLQVLQIFCLTRFHRFYPFFLFLSSPSNFTYGFNKLLYRACEYCQELTHLR